METVECQVVVWDRGRTRSEVVPLEEQAIRKKCWREIAAIKAAVLLEMPFQEVLEKARYGFRREDKERLFGKVQKEGEKA